MSPGVVAVCLQALEDALQVIRNPGVIPLGAPGSVVRRVQDVGRALEMARALCELVKVEPLGADAPMRERRARLAAELLEVLR